MSWHEIICNKQMQLKQLFLQNGGSDFSVSNIFWKGRGGWIPQLPVEVHFAIQNTYPTDFSGYSSFPLLSTNSMHKSRTDIWLRVWREIFSVTSSSLFFDDCSVNVSDMVLKCFDLLILTCVCFRWCWWKCKDWRITQEKKFSGMFL